MGRFDNGMDQPNATNQSCTKLSATDHHMRPTPWGLLLLTAAMLMLILYFGLRFKDAAIINDVALIEDQAGLRFQRSGIAFAEAVDYPAPDNAGNERLSIEFAMKPGAESDGHFRFLLQLHGGQDAEQLVIGQWQSWLIIMHGDDYDAKRRQPRIAVKAFHPEQKRFVSVVSGHDGTAVYLDGQLAERRRDLRLKTPAAGTPKRLVLGNSIYGRHAWVGDLYGLATYDQVLGESTIRGHFGQWAAEGTFAFALPEKTTSLYLFDEQGGQRIADRSGRGNDVRIPPKLTILSKEFLTTPFAEEEYNRSLVQDMVLNFTGFIPMGFLLSALMWHGRRTVAKRLLLVLLACGAVSLGIELAQAWIPSRSSQMLDLILNTLGAGAGVLIHSAGTAWRSSRA